MHPQFSLLAGAIDHTKRVCKEGGKFVLEQRKEKDRMLLLLIPQKHFEMSQLRVRWRHHEKTTRRFEHAARPVGTISIGIVTFDSGVSLVTHYSRSHVAN